EPGGGDGRLRRGADPERGGKGWIAAGQLHGLQRKTLPAGEGPKVRENLRGRDFCMICHAGFLAHTRIGTLIPPLGRNTNGLRGPTAPRAGGGTEGGRPPWPRSPTKLTTSGKRAEVRYLRTP